MDFIRILNSFALNPRENLLKFKIDPKIYDATCEAGAAFSKVPILFWYPFLNFRGGVLEGSSQLVSG